MRLKDLIHEWGRSLFRRRDEPDAELARIHAALQAEVRERTRAEQARDQFFELSLDMLAVAGTDGYFKHLNPAWEQVLGWTMEELKSRPYIDLVHPDDVEATAREAQKLQLGGDAIDFENRYQARDGSFRWLSWRATALPEQGLIFAVARDIDERKKIEQMKNDFISVVSHELRTPLTSIRGALGLISGGVAGELPEKVRVLMEIASKNSERLVHLINDILDIEKIEAGKMSFQLAPLELLPLVEHALESNRPYAGQYQVELQIVEAEPGLRVWADAERIQQVMANLLSNAAKFSPHGGTVEVRVTREEGLARVSVTDHGRGIPPDFQERIFQKFAQADSSSTRQKGGTGLGLSICKAIVERHGGRIGFETEPGAGTTFSFELPLRAAEIPEEPLHAVPRILICEDDPERARILYVEDDADLQRVVAAIVERDADVEHALNLEEAREKLARETFQLVILDLGLPDGSGLDLLPLLGSLAPPTPVIIFSVREVEPPTASRVASVVIKSQTSNSELMERIQAVLAPSPAGAGEGREM